MGHSSVHSWGKLCNAFFPDWPQMAGARNYLENSWVFMHPSFYLGPGSESSVLLQWHPCWILWGSVCLPPRRSSALPLLITWRLDSFCLLLHVPVLGREKYGSGSLFTRFSLFLPLTHKALHYKWEAISYHQAFSKYCAGVGFGFGRLASSSTGLSFSQSAGISWTPACSGLALHMKNGQRNTKGTMEGKKAPNTIEISERAPEFNLKGVQTS